ncbi:SMI1/KNR4 family protein [Kitasatospora cineracea]|uniref:SMI1/KNR4 family protein n=1 Tax=Kitasatospora cineracea TaxID=88074 RepID=UPI0033D8900F
MTVERLERDVREFVARLVRGAPEGWTDFELTVKAGPAGTECDGWWVVPGRVPRPTGAVAGAEALAAAIAAERGWRGARLAVRGRPGGTFDFGAEPGTVLSGDTVVLDPGYVHPLPDERAPGSALPPAGDAARAVAALRAFLRGRAELLGEAEQSAPPATPGQVAEAERRLGHRLPDDLRALYLTTDGGGGTSGLIDGRELLTLDEMVHAAEHLRYAGRFRFAWDEPGDAAVPFEPRPHGAVRRCHDHPGWVPFTTDGSGNHHAVDLAPAAAGRPGQVLDIGADHHEGPRYVADSVTSLLVHHLDLLERGHYALQDDWPPHLLLDRDPDEEPEEPEWSDTGLPAAPGPDLQSVRITPRAPAAPLDLAPLAAAPRLRRLDLGARTAIGLGALRPLPVEFLRAGLDGEGLAPLAGHPHLGALDLACDVPLDLAPLRALPALWWLDLSRCAVVQDLGVLGELAGLRYLALTREQWAELLERDALPPGLVAARSVGAEATAQWAARIGHPAGDSYRVEGISADGS